MRLIFSLFLCLQLALAPQAQAVTDITTHINMSTGTTLGASTGDAYRNRLNLIGAGIGYLFSGGDAANVSATSSAAMLDYDHNCGAYCEDIVMAFSQIRHLRAIEDRCVSAGHSAADCATLVNEAVADYHEGRVEFAQFVLGLVPVIGDIAGAIECVQAPSTLTCGGALVGVVPGLGDAGGVILRHGDEVTIVTRQGDTITTRPATVNEIAGARNGGRFSRTEFDQRFSGQFRDQAQADEAYRQYRLAAESDTELVLGRLPDTEAGAQLGMTRLDAPNDLWSPSVNDAFIQGGIDAGRPFYLGSNPDISNFRAGAQFDASGNFVGRGDYPETVFLREMRQLRDAGYVRVGDYMLPPN